MQDDSRAYYNYNVDARLGHTMKTPSHNRPVTAGSISRQRRGHSNDHDYNDDNDCGDVCSAQQQHPTPNRPSTQRSTKSTPRALAEAGKRLSGGTRSDEDAIRTMRSEMETLKTKLRASDLAKSQAQVIRETDELSVVAHMYSRMPAV